VVPLLDKMKDMAYVFNLNHGIDKHTDTKSVEFLVETIKRYRQHIG